MQNQILKKIMYKHIHKQITHFAPASIQVLRYCFEPHPPYRRRKSLEGEGLKWQKTTRPVLNDLTCPKI